MVMHLAHGFLIVALLGCTFAGCATHTPDPLQPKTAAAESYEATFMVAANRARADLFQPDDDLIANGPPVVVEDALVTLRGGGRRYRVFCDGLANAGTGMVSYKNDDPELQVHEGIGYAWGWRPLITTDRVTTITDGTKVLVQIDGAIHRVFMLSPGSTLVRVRNYPACRAGDIPDDDIEPEYRELTESWSFVECTLGTENTVQCVKLAGPKDLFAPEHQVLRAWVRDVLKRQRLKQLADE
jgi:hypothetical protein